jgi:heme/copper-type cytochrome/quinol oxidase subunit 2
MRDKRLLWVLAGAAAVVVLFVVLRPGGGDDEDAAETATETNSVSITVSNGQTETETTVETETEAPATTAPPPAPDVVAVRLTVRGGRPVDGIARPSVKQGRRVRIVVRSDVADHVHLHGYDIMRDVAPGRPAQLVFTADIPGRFEIELEDSRTQLAELEVRP